MINLPFEIWNMIAIECLNNDCEEVFKTHSLGKSFENICNVHYYSQSDRRYCANSFMKKYLNNLIMAASEKDLHQRWPLQYSLSPFALMTKVDWLPFHEPFYFLLLRPIKQLPVDQDLLQRLSVEASGLWVKTQQMEMDLLKRFCNRMFFDQLCELISKEEDLCMWIFVWELWINTKIKIPEDIKVSIKIYLESRKIIPEDVEEYDDDFSDSSE